MLMAVILHTSISHQDPPRIMNKMEVESGEMYKGRETCNR